MIPFSLDPDLSISLMAWLKPAETPAHAVQRRSFPSHRLLDRTSRCDVQFPERTKESSESAALQGAGMSVDVTFTKDAQLVCRHAENDLHTTTNILVTPLAEKCTKKFTPATFDVAGNRLTAATAECRASDLTLAEFKTLTGKMDAFNPNARTPAEFLGGATSWRTDLYTGRGTLMTLKESIRTQQAAWRQTHARVKGKRC